MRPTVIRTQRHSRLDETYRPLALRPWGLVVLGLVSGLLATVTGCSREALDRTGFSCDDGRCAREFICHPQTDRCVPEIAIACDGTSLCPTAVQSGDACPSEGSFLPCDVGPLDCDPACRTCTADLRWSACVDTSCSPTTTDGTELCNGVDDDCNGTADDLSQAEADSSCASQFPAADHVEQWGCSAATCSVRTCELGWADIFGGPANGCETQCTPTTPPDEVCDGKDNDCDGVVDGEDTADCTIFYVDADGDALGDAADWRCLCAATDPHTATVAGDCDDSNANCGTDCTDADDDGWCADRDCDDSLTNCATDCTDDDGDTFCRDTDCKDNDASCTTDCSTCPPAFLSLSSPGTTAACDTATLTIDLDGLVGAIASLSCSALSQVLDGPTGFESGRESWNDRSRVAIRNWPDGFPTPACDLGGRFVRFADNASAHMQLNTQLEVTGYENATLEFIAGYRNNPPSGEKLELLSCCGAGCTPLVFAQVDNSSDGGMDDCASYSLELPADATDCSSLMVRFEWNNGSNVVGVDAVRIAADLAFTQIIGTGAGSYSTTIASCRAATIDVTCTWDDGVSGPLSDTATVDFQ